MFQVDLVADTGVRWHHRETLEALLRPAQQAIALGVPSKLQLPVGLEGVSRAGHVRDHRVIDDELHGNSWIDARPIATQLRDRVPECDQIHHCRDPGEVLHQDSLRPERELPGRVRAGRPFRQGLNIGSSHGPTVLVAQEVLEQDLDAVGQPADVPDTFQSRESADLVGPVCNRHRGPGAEAVIHHSFLLLVRGFRRGLGRHRIGRLPVATGLADSRGAPAEKCQHLPPVSPANLHPKAAGAPGQWRSGGVVASAQGRSPGQPTP